MFDLRSMPPSCDPALLASAQQVEPATVGHFRFLGFPRAAIRPMVTIKGRIVGTAVTLALPSLDSTLLHHAVGLTRPGDILLIDRLGDDRYACLGGGIANALARSGAKGAIVDGLCADPDELEASGLPIWGTGISAITTRTPGLAGAMNIPISIGGAVVQPGDLVIADSGGIVVIPVGEAAATLAKALSLQKFERDVLGAMQPGDLLGELTGASDLIRKSLRAAGKDIAH